MSKELRDAVRAVLDAAREWYSSCGPYGPVVAIEDSPLGALATGVEALEHALAGATEDERPRPWAKVLARDEALGADGGYHRITGVWDGGRTVTVEIEVNGARKRYRKDPAVEVTIRRHAGPELDALAVLERAGFDVSTVASAS